MPLGERLARLDEVILMDFDYIFWATDFMPNRFIDPGSRRLEYVRDPVFEASWLARNME